MGIKKMYQKEIIYLNQYNNGVKEGCVGYLKSEEREGKFRLELQIKNIPGALSGNYPIRLQDTTGWHETGMLILGGGSGRWTGGADEPALRVEIDLTDSDTIKGQSRNVSKQEARAGEHTGLAESEGNELRERSMAESEEIETRWQGMMEAEDIGTRERGMTESEVIETRQRNMAESGVVELRLRSVAELGDAEARHQVMTASVARELERETIAETSNSAPGQRNMAEEPESRIKQQSIAEASESKIRRQSMSEPLRHERGLPDEPLSSVYKPGQGTVTESAEKRAENTPLYESKWEQLLATYEQIHPYGDNRVYVKLEPKDFVILPSGYQHLVNNSFLLHGFYNYRYLILGREKDFYLGVPGVFYEREKMVALMFGFEAFECEGGNAEEGKFGYYLRKVEL